jgi:hypothetical protein
MLDAEQALLLYFADDGCESIRETSETHRIRDNVLVLTLCLRPSGLARDQRD